MINQNEFLPFAYSRLTCLKKNEEKLRRNIEINLQSW